jgi:CRP-like cAMP-binding protein
MNIKDLKTKNTLLASVAQADWESWISQLQLVELEQDQVLYESGNEMSYVYFPIHAIVSLLHILENGGCTEIAMTGREGVVGISVFMGSVSTPSRGVVQQAGLALRASADFIKENFKNSPTMMQMMLRYTQALITQMSQVAVCNRHHAIEQQLCRWLLLNFDRLDTDVLPITHEKISTLLGVRREGITKAASHLQENHLIQYSRGQLHLLNREGLHARSCECYDVVKHEYERLQPSAVHL